MAITLNANKFIGTLANLIAYSRVLDTYKIGEAINEPLDKFRGADIANGDSTLILTAGIPSVYDVDFDNSTLLTVVKPTVKEQVISVSAWKAIQLSINRYLLAGAFINESAMATLTAYLLFTMQVAKKLHMYDTIEELVHKRMGAEITANNHIVTINGVAVDPNDDVQTQLATRTNNATLFFKWLKKELRQYELGKKKGYKDATDTTGMKVVESKDNMCLILSPELMASLDVDALAVLLKSDELTKRANIDFIEMDMTAGGAGSGYDNISSAYAVLCSYEAFVYGYFYQVATSFFDASILNTNNWLHFSYYKGNVEYAPLEVLKLDNYTFD